MSDMPAWYAQLAWSEARPFTQLIADKVARKLVASGAGLYAFTKNNAELSAINVLYVGKADGARQTLRTRMAVYVRRLRAPHGKQSGHAGMEKLCAHYAKNPNQLFVRWCGCILTRDVEGGLISLFDPLYNGKDERLGGLDDDERIPDCYLYDVNE